MNTTTHEEKWAALCVEHEGWLRTLAGRYARRFPTIDFDDLLQEGRIAVGRALETYDESKGKFITYLTFWAGAKMNAYCKNHCSAVRLPCVRWYGATVADLKTARENAEPGATEDEIQAAAIMMRMPRTVSLDAPADPTDGDDERTIAWFMAAPEPEPAPDEERAAMLARFFATMDEADREMFKEHFGIDCDAQILEDMAKKRGLSREGVRVRMVSRISTFRRWRNIANGEPVILGSPAGAPGRRKKNSRRALTSWH